MNNIKKSNSLKSVALVTLMMIMLECMSSYALGLGAGMIASPNNFKARQVSKNVTYKYYNYNISWSYNGLAVKNYTITVGGKTFTTSGAVKNKTIPGFRFGQTYRGTVVANGKYGGKSQAGTFRITIPKN